MTQKVVVLLVALIILTGCSTTRLLTPTQQDVDRVSNKFAGLTLDELNQGKAIFETNCQTCHGLKNPTSRGEERWRQIVPKMTAKVNKKRNNAINAEDQEKLLRYLITMSQAPKGK